LRGVREILNEVQKGKRLYEEDALFLLHEAELLSLGSTAQAVADARHPGKVATFLIDRNINYTNICVSRCRFCAFYRDQESEEAYLLSNQEILNRVAEAVSFGATQVMLQGGLHPDLPIDYYTGLIREIKKRFSVFVHSLSPPEILHIASVSHLSVEETLKRLKNAGLDSLPGGGAEILVDHVRDLVSPQKIRSQAWLEVMETAHALGIKTTATMMMGSIETLEDRIEHLSKIRKLQDKTMGFRAFIPWTYQPGNTELSGSETSPFDYLRTLAVARLFLDNIENIQGSWLTQGKDIGQITLLFGANDLGSIMLEENVVRAAGVVNRMTEQEMVDLIRRARKIPAQRDTEYRIVKRYE
jgi:cyclic dehypoxanthinyl futalosine synthase